VISGHDHSRSGLEKSTPEATSQAATSRATDADPIACKTKTRAFQNFRQNIDVMSKLPSGTAPS
jgi:hypothetical protein